MQDFWSQIVHYTDILGEELSDIDNPEHLLPKILIRAERDRQSLEAQFNPVSTTAAIENLSIVHQLRNGITMAHELLQQHAQLRAQERKLAIEMKAHEDRTETIARDFRVTVKRLHNTTKIIDYLRCLDTFFKYSTTLQQSLATQSFEEALSAYSKLVHLTEFVHDTSTEHLRSYSANLTVYWYEQLKVVLSLRMEELLRKIEFPYVHKMPSSHVIELFDSYRNELKQECALLLKLRLPDRVTHVDVQSRLRFIGWKPLPLLIKILLQALTIRFNFHFYGKQKTNDRRKPEWYFNQVLSWIVDHEYFLTEQLQPLLNELDHVPRINAKIEFIRGLIELIIIKLDSQISSILIDSILFTHYIQEILVFSQRLFDNDIAYPRHLPNCMNFLCDEILFEKWFQIEQDIARTKLIHIFQSSTAHQSVYERMLERHPDELKISQCAETFLTLIHAMEDRYRLVPYPSCALRLLSLQVDIIHDFLHDLKASSIDETDISTTTHIDPLSKRFCSILNSIVYVADVVEKWKKRSHYIRLQYLYEQYQLFAQKYGPSMDDENLSILLDEHKPTDLAEERLQIDPTLAQQFDLTQLENLELEIPISSTSIFDTVLQQYRDIQEADCQTIVHHILKFLKIKSRRYLKEKWSSMPNPKDYLTMSILPSSADVLFELQTIASNLLNYLLKSIFAEIWTRILIAFDEFLYNCVVNDHTFNEGGAAQFLFDVNRGWSRVCSDYVPQLFNRCRESALLLTMPVGSALLLIDALKRDLSTMPSSSLSIDDDRLPSSPLPTALHEMGIQHLSEFDADQVLKRRLDLTNF